MLDRPAVVSFSGGRTSGYMLYQIVQAFGGTLPEDVRPVFLNTGRELPETLDFVERCGIEFGVNITWIEFAAKAPNKYRIVDYATASRDGEPFRDLIKAKQHLPNVTQRYCTTWLKVKPNNRHARYTLGWKPVKEKGRVVGGGYTSAIGLRYDEPRRLAKLRASLARHPKYLMEENLFGEVVRRKNPKWREPPPPGERPVVPLAVARATRQTVMDFWQRMRGGVPLEQWLAMPKRERPGWDLELFPDEGNCDLCFLKGPNKLVRLERKRPGLTGWWERMQRMVSKTAKKADGARFIKGLSYTAIRETAERDDDQWLPFEDGDETCAYTCTD